MKEETIDTHSKALRINLDPRWYGTFAEIGAGQEVVRWFFRVGGAAGTSQFADAASKGEMRAFHEGMKLHDGRLLHESPLGIDGSWVCGA